jgi:hypothetical protein
VKEALVKARGTGFRGDPAEVRLVPADEGPDDPEHEEPGLTWRVPGAPGAVVSPDPQWPGGAAPEGLIGAVVVLPPSS